MHFAGMPQAHILVVDDNENDIVLIRRVLRKARLRSFSVKNGESAVAYLSGTGDYSDRKKYPLPVLVLVDLKMPGISGLDVVLWIRHQPFLKDLRVVVLATSDDLRDVNEAYRRGANSFLVKPLELETVGGIYLMLQAQGMIVAEAAMEKLPQRRPIVEQQ